MKVLDARNQLYLLAPPSWVSRMDAHQVMIEVDRLRLDLRFYPVLVEDDEGGFWMVSRPTRTRLEHFGPRLGRDNLGTFNPYVVEKLTAGVPDGSA